MRVLVFSVRSTDSLRSGMPQGEYAVWVDEDGAALMYKPVGAHSFGPAVEAVRMEVQSDGANA